MISLSIIYYNITKVDLYSFILKLTGKTCEKTFHKPQQFSKSDFSFCSVFMNFF